MIGRFGGGIRRRAPDRATFASAVRRRVTVDARALAAFRIALGALVLADLTLRSRNLGAFYTDAGVLPRVALSRHYTDVYSLHAAAGSARAQVALFALAGVLALAMIVGYRTRLATVLSWALLLSLHTRNPMVLNGGDILLRVLLFWAMFLPLGARWSVDALRSDSRRSTVVSVATAALLGQVLLVYGTNAIHKLYGTQWTSGEAAIYAFSLDQFTVLLGNHLAEVYPLLRAFTYLWMALLLASPLLLLLTDRPRALLATAFAGMHLGMLLTMQLGIFPLVAVAGLLPFYPPGVWDALTVRARRAGIAARLAALGDRLDGVLTPGSRLTTRARGDSPSRARSAVSTTFSAVLPACFFLLVLASNAEAAAGVTTPEPADRALEVTGTDQSWRMFAPEPMRTDGWYVVPGTLTNGTTVDLYRDSSVDWDRPPNIDRTYPTARWRKYLSNVWSVDNKGHRSYFANYLCQRWNRSHDPNVANLTVYYMAQESRPYNGTEPIERHRIHEHDCGGDMRQWSDAWID